MGSLLQTANQVSIQLGDESYRDTVENFKLDGGSAPDLPAGIASRAYIQGKRHTLIDADGDVNPHMDEHCPRECKWADDMIAAVFDLRLNQAARLHADKLAKLDAARTQLEEEHSATRTELSARKAAQA